MTALVDIVNLGLQYMGGRTTVSAAELAALSSNEAIQANLLVEKLRTQTLRMAPWGCALNAVNLTYITSQPGTPENTSPATQLWQKGQPMIPWLYEYQYPVDCMKAGFLIPAAQTGFPSGVPITTAVTGPAAMLWTGPPIRYKVAVDQFFGVTAATVAAGGDCYAVGDIITLDNGTEDGDVPLGAPAQLRVLTVAGGAVATVEVVNQIYGSSSPVGGSYFTKPTNPVAQASTDGIGSGATFNLTFAAKNDQRIILTNQQNATLCYVKDITNIDTLDQLFIDAWAAILGARLALPLSGDKDLVKINIAAANSKIMLARQADGNEGLTVNDFTPDWIRARGIDVLPDFPSPWSQVDWGPLWGVV